MPLLELKNVSKNYPIGTGFLKVLENIDETAEKGELIAIVGPSGAGKSTLMHIIGGLDAPSFGEVIFDGEDIYKMKEADLNRYRGDHMGFVFQSHYLLDDFTALENVMMPALVAGSSKAQARKAALKLLEDVGLGDRASHFPSELSGGERQRTAVARALVNSPKIILADEPTGNLDKSNSIAVTEILASLAKDGVCVMIVTHDEEIAERCHRRIRLEKI